MKTSQFNELILYQMFIDFSMVVNYNSSLFYDLGVLTSKWETLIKNNERKKDQNLKYLSDRDHLIVLE